MNGDHPWLDWLKVLIIFAGGMVIVMVAVKLLINWAHKNDHLAHTSENQPSKRNDKDAGGPPSS
jgi:hypothetical protein